MKKPIALVCGLLCATLLVFGPVCTANAATVDLDGNTATGIRNLMVLGTPYNVEFVETTPLDLYGIRLQFPFPDQSQAFQATIAVANALNINSPLPTSVGPNAIQNAEEYFIGYDLDPGEFEPWFVQSGDYSKFDNDWGVNDPSQLLPGSVKMFADFTVVPLPAAVWLLGSGLVGVIGLRRKRPKT